VAEILRAHAGWVRERFLGRTDQNPGP
jgi:hypothetical protein